jgi:uncharacterized protein
MSPTNLTRVLFVSAAFSLILGCYGTTQARLGPGFDCAKARQPLAQLICASDDLSLIDYYLNQAYSAYRDTVDAAGRSGWLRIR